MKYMKYFLALAIAFLAMTSLASAQGSLAFLGGGSSALFVELGQAAWTYENGLGSNTGGACVWTQGKTASIVARDNRTGSPVDVQGNIWVVWGAGSGTCASPAGTWNVYAYQSLDSVLGDRCYFEVDSSDNNPGCLQVMTIAAGTAGTKLLCYPSTSSCGNFGDTAGGIPSTVIGLINGQHYFVAGTDIRPEDAKYASFRMLTPCGQAIFRQPFDLILRQTYGLGYNTGTTGVGITIQSFYSTTTFPVLDFNIAGNDPINTGHAVPTYTVSTVGAQPIVVAVSPNDTTGTGVNLAGDIPAYVLMNFYNGSIGRSSDLLNASTGAPISQSWAVTTLVREPLSGTYNTFEWSLVNSSQFHDSQDGFNCNSSTGALVTNPMNLTSLNGNPANGGGQLAFRRRAIGTGEMTKFLNLGTDTDNRLGYFFWSAGNAAGLTNTKYLTVNGVDPLQNSYTGGALPGSGASGDPGLSAVTFKNLNAGDYPIWSALRLVSKSPTPAGVTNLIAAAQTLNSTQFDFIPLSKLNVWHSHYYMNAINVNTAANGTTISTSGDLCNTPGALTEQGGDAGGAQILKKANSDFCTDFAVTTGLVNKTN